MVQKSVLDQHSVPNMRHPHLKIWAAEYFKIVIFFFKAEKPQKVCNLDSVWKNPQMFRCFTPAMIQNKRESWSASWGWKLHKFSSRLLIGMTINTSTVQPKDYQCINYFNCLSRNKLCSNASGLFSISDVVAGCPVVLRHFSPEQDFSWYFTTLLQVLTRTRKCRGM